MNFLIEIFSDRSEVIASSSIRCNGVPMASSCGCAVRSPTGSIAQDIHLTVHRAGARGTRLVFGTCPKWLSSLNARHMAGSWPFELKISVRCDGITLVLAPPILAAHRVRMASNGTWEKGQSGLFPVYRKLTQPPPYARARACGSGTLMREIVDREARADSCGCGSS